MNGAHFAMWVPAVVCCAILAAQAHILKSKRPLSHHIEAHLLTSVDFSSCQGNHFAIKREQSPLKISRSLPHNYIKNLNANDLSFEHCDQKFVKKMKSHLLFLLEVPMFLLPTTISIRDITLGGQFHHKFWN